VRLPKDVAFPKEVKEVAVLRDGQRRVSLRIPFGTTSLTRPGSILARATSRRRRRGRAAMIGTKDARRSEFLILID